MNTRHLIALCILFATTGSHRAATAEDDWQQVVALDAGPQGGKPRTPEEAHEVVLGHLGKQERALRGFLAAHPSDARSFEAKLRLSRALQIHADFAENEALRSEAKRMLDELEKSATPAQLAEVDFARIAAFMRTLKKTDRAQRGDLLTMARKFQSDHPADRRLAALFAQVATLFETQPKTMESLLEDAQPLAKDDELKGRIADDLKRVRSLGKPVALAGVTLQGKLVDVATLRGKPAIVVFFADFSPQSATALTALKQAVAESPQGAVNVVGVSLDSKREDAAGLLRGLGISWPVIWDGKGWESPGVRALGINALPTAWLLDKEGRLRSLNALEGTAGQVRQLMRE